MWNVPPKAIRTVGGFEFACYGVPAGFDFPADRVVFLYRKPGDSWSSVIQEGPPMDYTKFKAWLDAFLLKVNEALSKLFTPVVTKDPTNFTELDGWLQTKIVITMVNGVPSVSISP